MQRSVTLCCAAVLCIKAAGRDEARQAENWGRRQKSRPQDTLRPKGPKMEVAGRYYDKDQADRERSDLSACNNNNKKAHFLFQCIFVTIHFVA